MKRNILFLLSLCMLLLTCSDGNDPIKEIENKDPFITLKKSNIDFTNEGGSESISIESNVNWIAKSSASWCTITPSSGNKSTASITLTAPANEDYDNRSCTVTIESGGISKTITVNQGENLGLLITQDRYELGNEESTIKVEVKANVDFEVEINDEWISKIETRGLKTSMIEFKIAENDTYGNRDGSITIKQKGGNMSSTIKVYQSQEDAIILSKKNFELSSEAQSIEVEIKTNVDYEIIIPEDAKDWVSHTTTRALRTETVVLDVAENKGYDERTVEVIVKDKKTDLEETVTIKQAANTGLIISEDKYELTNDGGTIEVEVKANVEFDIEIADKWITRVETRGLTKTKLQFHVAKNENYDSREGTITIKQKGGNLSSIIKVYQSQKDAIIISEKDLELTSEAQAVEVELKTNIDYEIIIPEDAKDWVSHTTTRALRTETVVLDIAQNKDYDERTAKIVVKDKKTNLQDTITIIQALKEVIILSQKIYEVQSEGEAIIVDLNTNINFEYKISTDSDWIKPIKTRGLSNYKLNFTIEKNNIYNKREGFIEFYQIDGNISDTLWIKQLEKPDLGNGGKTNSFIISEEGLYRFSIGDYIGDKAFLLWNENGKDDIINVEHKNGYIYFEKKNFEKGNAMISLVKNGKIVWSWHIWSTDKPKTIEVNREKWMDRNLGATTTTPNDLDVYGLSYNPGNPFPFPGPKYEDYIITSSPSIPNGWYVASGYGFYKASNMPSPANPMQLCTNTDAYGNSDYFRLRYSQTPKGYYLPSVNIFQNILGYEPQLNNNGVYITEDLYVPCIYENKPSNNYGLYLCAGVYNNVAVDTYAIMFYEKVSKKTYTQGASLLPIRCYGY